jgi:hypothetical protein
MSAILLTDSSGRPYDPSFMAAASAVTAGSGVGIAAAQQSPIRGHINPMDWRQKYVLTGEAGRVVRQKMRWLKANSYGAIATLVAAWEGPVRPDPDTGDADYNKVLRDFWQETQVDSCCYDLSRKFTAESYQEMMEVNALTMGDGLTVFRWDKDGSPAARFYDALSVDNPSNTYNTPEWIDGVKVDADHAHLAYRIINDSKPGTPWRALQDVVNAADCFFHAGFEHPADVRGVSPFLAAINPMIDLQEIDMAVIELIKIASRIGMSLETAAGSPIEEPAPVDGPWAKTMFRPSSPAPTGAATDPPEIPRYVEEVMGGPSLARLAAGQKFFGHERLVVTLYGAVKPDPAALEFSGRIACIMAIADAIRAKLSPGPVDISRVMEDIAKLLDDSITGVEMPATPAPVMDLSKIDFETLRNRFKDSKHKNTDIEVLKAAIRAQLEKMIRLNQTRTDFLEKFEALIEAYNAGSRNIEELFEELLRLSRNLSEEQQRHVRENMSEEELVVFDILTRPAPELSEEERAEVKKVARELLTRLKLLLVINWRQKAAARSTMKLAIEDVLDTGLPAPYSKELYELKCAAVFEHFYEGYPDRGKGVYAQAG